jgi:hypothetical protein
MGLRQDVENLEEKLNCLLIKFEKERAKSEELFFLPLALVIGRCSDVAAINATIDYWVANDYDQWVLASKMVVNDEEVRDYFEENLDNDVYFQAFLTKAGTL